MSLLKTNRKTHWENVYTQKGPEEVSWFQTLPEISLQFLVEIGISHDDKIIDVGAGSSVFVDELIKKGYRDITVLDISSKALQHSKERLGERAQKVKWVEADITNFEPKDQYSLWHDRAVLHFLTAKKDRENYVRVLETVLKSGGHVIIATFNLNGPPKCSGLPVERYDARKIQGELGKSFEFVNGVDEVHMTPGKIPQNFTYFYFRKK